MPPLDAPSPTPSNNAVKRSRAAGSSHPSSAARSNKRKKADAPSGANSEGENARQRPAFGVGMVKGREDEWTEPGDVKTKINFLDLPVEALYRYLEVNDLVPRWEPSPWSEAPCEPPLYLNYPQAPGVNIVSGSPKGATPLEDVHMPPPVEEKPVVRPVEDRPEDAPEGEEGELDENGDAFVAPPTTRSKTAPTRRKSPEPTPIKRGVFTLSDVHAARAILAEKANQHWMKGLGGGQNREGETIVNFLYKNKVGHGRLLRVYNPVPAPFS